MILGSHISIHKAKEEIKGSRAKRLNMCKLRCLFGVKGLVFTF